MVDNRKRSRRRISEDYSLHWSETQRRGERGKRRGSLIAGRDNRQQLTCCLLWVWVLGDTGMIVIVTSALIIWKGLMCFTGSESPVVVVLTGSKEPGFRRVLFFSPFFSYRVFLCSLGFFLKDFSIRLDLQSILLYFAGEQGTFWSILLTHDLNCFKRLLVVVHG